MDTFERRAAELLRLDDRAAGRPGQSQMFFIDYSILRCLKQHIYCRSPAYGAYARPTVSSITRSRSLSPSRRRQIEGLNLDGVYSIGERPPFVVKKVSLNVFLEQRPF